MNTIKRGFFNPDEMFIKRKYFIWKTTYARILSWIFMYFLTVKIKINDEYNNNKELIKNLLGNVNNININIYYYDDYEDYNKKNRYYFVLKNKNNNYIYLDISLDIYNKYQILINTSNNWTNLRS